MLATPSIIRMRQPVFVAAATGTAIGDMTDRSGLAAAFDGNTNQDRVGGAGKLSTTSCYIGKNWGTNKRLAKVVLWVINNGGLVSSGAIPTVSIYGKASLPSSGTDGTLLFQGTPASPNASGVDNIFPYCDPTNVFQYHWAYWTWAGSVEGDVAEVQFYEYL